MGLTVPFMNRVEDAQKRAGCYAAQSCSYMLRLAVT